jgi:hypothetical protein
VGPFVPYSNDQTMSVEAYRLPMFVSENINTGLLVPLAFSQRIVLGRSVTCVRVAAIFPRRGRGRGRPNRLRACVPSTCVRRRVRTERVGRQCSRYNHTTFGREGQTCPSLKEWRQ